jgi:hypothetical protein
MHADRKMTKASWIDHPSEERDLDISLSITTSKELGKKERKT